MIGAGKLSQGHKDLTTDCFACHTAFMGSSSEKCVSCHIVDDIGLKTTKGIEIQRENPVSFHRHLSEENCVACHTDHKGENAYASIQQFSHELLTIPVQNQCDSCHHSPKDSLHQKIKGNCDQCHDQNQWKPAIFEHDLLEISLKNQCDSCHHSPKDSLHRKIKGNCAQCHDQNQWKPATFEHEKYFRFDRHHDVACAKCHVNDNYGQYSCYECHEHSVSKIRSEHREEGIFEYENCTECHRSANEDEAERLWKSKRRQLKKGDNRSEERKFQPYQKDSVEDDDSDSE